MKVTASDIGLLLIRVMVGVVFMFHGSQKLFGWFGGHGIEGFAKFLSSLSVPAPTLSATMAGSAEFFGGLVLVLGSGTRIAAIPMAFTMAIAVTMVHNKAFDAQGGGMEYALTLGVILVALILTGPGRLTAGRLLPVGAGSAPAVRPAAA